MEAVKARHDAVGIPHEQGPQLVTLRPTTELFWNFPYHVWIRYGSYLQIVVLIIIKIARKLTFFALIVMK